MHPNRRKGLLAIAFAVVSAFILLGRRGFGSVRPSTLTVGFVVLLSAVFEAATGTAPFLPRSVKKSEAPTLFWGIVLFTVSLGVACVALSYL